MKATFNDFIDESSMYKMYDDDPTAIHVFENGLSTDENTIAMVDASVSGKPALSACISDVENYFSTRLNPVFNLNEYFVKQYLGRMVKTILKLFGYLAKSQKDMPKSCNTVYVKSAMTYALTENPTIKVVRAIVEEI